MIRVINMGNGLFVIRIIMNELHTLDIPELKDQINDSIEKNKIEKVVLDLSDVNIITSTGIGIFLSINSTVDSNFCLACAGDEIRKVLELTKVSSIIKMCDTIEEAVEIFHNSI